MENKERTKIIVEIGQAHDGSLGIAHSFIDALSGLDIDAIKWQAHIAEAESSDAEPFRVNFSYEDKRRYDYWQRVQFSREHWAGLREHCRDKGFDFICSPFSVEAIRWLEDLDVDAYKVGSGEVSNHLLLENLRRTGRPVILSSGLSTFSELDAAVGLFDKLGHELSILQCTTSYPTSPENWGLNVLEHLRERYRKARIGFSDHSGDIYSCLAARTLGAQVLEFHLTFDKRMFGPDSRSSLTIDQVAKLVEGVRELDRAFNSPRDKSAEAYCPEVKKMFSKTLAVNRTLQEGEVLRFEDLEAKKPGGLGVPARDYQKVLGRVLRRPLQKWDFLSYEDLKGEPLA